MCEIPGCASERPGAAWQLTLTYELLEVNEDLVVRASETLGKKYVYADAARRHTGRALPLAQIH